jgi:hypothetical protein
MQPMSYSEWVTALNQFTFTSEYTVFCVLPMKENMNALAGALARVVIVAYNAHTNDYVTAYMDLGSWQYRKHGQGHYRRSFTTAMQASVALTFATSFQDCGLAPCCLESVINLLP